jgi:secondary thiamine-phosphate synthase enzyme
MRQAQETLTVRTTGQGLFEITGEIAQWVSRHEMDAALLTLLCQHTSASLTIQENADPDVRHDLETFFARLVREDSSLYRHTMEGIGDMPAHIRSALTDVSLSIPINAGRMMLGTWQGIYLFEHRIQPHTRRVVLHLMGD